MFNFKEAIFVTFITIVLSLVAFSVVVSRKYNYDKGYENGFNVGVDEGVKLLVKVSNETKRSKKCYVAAIPIITDEHDTIVYYLTPFSCSLDTLINDRIKRHEHFN